MSAPRRQSYAQLKELVGRRISEPVLQQILHFWRTNAVYLWGDQHGRYYDEKMVHLALYKDLYHIGYCRLTTMFDLNIRVHPHTLRHNVTVIRLVLRGWAERQINLGNAEDWNEASRNVELGSTISNANLWIDSIDIPVCRSKGRGRKSEFWSFKINGLGRRYMILRDGEMRVRAIWGGYSPKVHDGTWWQMHKEWLEDHMPGAVILGDCHFGWGRDQFANLVVHNSYPQASNDQTAPPRSKPNDADCREEAAQRSNKESKSEIGEWDSLRGKCQEEVEELDKTMTIAVGVYNTLLG